MKIFAVSGNPVGHSLSPHIFQTAFAKSNEPHLYTRLLAQSAAEALEVARSVGLNGMSVTSPFKEEMAKLSDTLGGDAQYLKAVNVVSLKDDGIAAFNTDPDGVQFLLRKNSLDDVKGQTALVVGAGGAAKAAALALVREGYKVRLTTRDGARGRDSAERINVAHCDWSRLREVTKASHLVCFCLPVDPDGVDETWFSDQQIIVNARYPNNAVEQAALNAKASYIGGWDWLVGQAAQAYKIWTGVHMSDQALESLEQRPLEKTPKGLVALVGMMGVGKSEIGRKLADRLQYDYFGTDEQIVSLAGKSIAQIFKEDGETRFRELETTVIQKAVETKRRVLDLGGGALEREENRSLISQHSQTVWLYAPAEVCAQRAAGTDRPLLKGGDVLETVRYFYTKRVENYGKASDFLIDTSRRSALETAKLIASELKF